MAVSITTGTKLGRYEIRSKLGEGGMGEVYLARDTQLDRDIALKILTADVARDQQRLHRFLQEARAASAGKSVNLYDSRTGTPNLWSFPLDGSPMKQLTDFKPDAVFNRHLSVDHKWMAMARGLVTSDVVLISDFR
jgi:serine/threonine protein kinase